MTLQIACLVFNSVCCVIAWTFVFLICRAEKRADAARKASIEATRQILDGPPVAGTTTGSSSPSTSSTSSPGKGTRCADIACPVMDSPGGMVTGTANGALKKEPRRASTVTGSDEVLRNANAVLETHSTTSRGGASAEAISSTAAADRAADPAASSPCATSDLSDSACSAADCACSAAIRRDSASAASARAAADEYQAALAAADGGERS